MRNSNWAICPKCQKKLDDLDLDLDFFVLNKTLREDYEIFMRFDGILVVRYECKCHKCGFDYVYNDDADINEG